MTIMSVMYSVYDVARAPIFQNP